MDCHQKYEAYKHCKPIGAEGNAKHMQEPTYFNGKWDLDLQDEGIVVLENSSPELPQAFIRAVEEHRFWHRQDVDLIPV